MFELTRRTFLAATGAISITQAFSPAGTSAAMAAETADGMKFDDPQHNLDAQVRLWGGTDNRVRYGFGQGRAFAVFQGELAIPLFDARAVAWNRFRREPDGSYVRQTAFVQYHYNLDGGFAESWTNPVTGESRQLPVIRNEFGEVRFRTTGTDIPPEMEVETPWEDGVPRIFPWIVMGDDVWLSKEEMVRYRSAREGRRVVENAVRTYHTSLAELNDLQRPSVSSRMVEYAQSELFGFLGMPEGRSGHLLWRFVSRKHESLDDLPGDIRREVDRRNPELWEIPG